LPEAADAEQAAAMAAYMRDRFPFFGVKAPLRRRLQRDVTRRLATPDEATLRAVVDDCWSRPQRELQYFGGEYARARVQVCSPRFLATARRAISRKSWWDTVDLWAVLRSQGHRLGAARVLEGRARRCRRIRPCARGRALGPVTA